MRQRVSIVANLKNTFLAQIDLVLAQFEEIAKKTKYRDFSDISYGMYTRLRTAALAVIDRVSGPESIYAKQANNL